MFDLQRWLRPSCKRISPRPILGKALPDRTDMPCFALTRFDMKRCTGCGERTIASAHTCMSTTTTTITMTTSGTRGQVGVD